MKNFYNNEGDYMKKNVNNDLYINLDEVPDMDLLSAVVSKLLAIHEVDKEYKLSLSEDTAYYIFVVLQSLMQGGYYQYLQRAFSEKTEEAFNTIGAKKYGKLFKKYNTSIIKELREVKGIFKRRKERKIMISYTKDFKVAWESLDKEEPLVPNYIIPFLKEKVVPTLNKYKPKEEKKETSE